MNINNPSDLRAAFKGLLGEDGTAQLGTIYVTAQELDAVTEEIIGAMVDNYMNHREPSACVSLVGRLLLAEIID
jgi:hypothetical protein